MTISGLDPQHDMLIVESTILAFAAQKIILAHGATVQNATSALATAFAAYGHSARTTAFVRAFLHGLARFFHNAATGRGSTVHTCGRCEIGRAIGLSLTIRGIVLAEVIHAIFGRGRTSATRSRRRDLAVSGCGNASGRPAMMWTSNLAMVTHSADTGVSGSVNIIGVIRWTGHTNRKLFC